MVAHVDQPIRSQRFIKAYLMIWGLLALGALAYLAALAFPPQHNPAPRLQTSEPDQSIRAMGKALASVDLMQREMQKDLVQLKDVVVEREVQERSVIARLSSLEEGHARLEASQQAAAAAAAPKAKVADKAQRKAPEPRPQARVISVGPEAAPGMAPAGGAESSPLETGSIGTAQPVIISQPVVTPQTVAAAQPVVTTTQPPAAAPAQPTITFGEPIVTASAPQNTFAVQIAAGPSLSALKLSWGILVERHGPALAQLQPRAVAPRSEGGPYRLLAGPLPNKTDADRVCSEMNVGRSGCFAVLFVGDPL